MKNWFAGLASAVLLVAIWQALVMLTGWPKFILPGPALVAETIWTPHTAEEAATFANADASIDVPSLLLVRQASGVSTVERRCSTRPQGRPGESKASVSLSDSGSLFAWLWFTVFTSVSLFPCGSIGGGK